MTPGDLPCSRLRTQALPPEAARAVFRPPLTGTGSSVCLSFFSPHLMPLVLLNAIRTYWTSPAGHIRRVQHIASVALGERAAVLAEGLTWAGTFHAVGARLLREHAPAIGLDPGFTIHDGADSADLMSLVRHRLGFSKTETRFPLGGTLDPPEASSDRSGAPLRDEDYLTLSTIHSAKGQEWKNVFAQLRRRLHPVRPRHRQQRGGRRRAASALRGDDARAGRAASRAADVLNWPTGEPWGPPRLRLAQPVHPR